MRSFQKFQVKCQSSSDQTKKKDNLTFLKKIRPNVKHKMKFKEKKERKKNIKVNVEH